MFGNLFDEESYQNPQETHTPNQQHISCSGGSTSGDTELKAPSVTSPPPLARPQCRLAGLGNQGATCYLNSLLQTLFLTPEFRESLFSLGENELGKLSDRNNPDAKVRVIPLQLQRLFTQLLFADLRSISTVELTESFGWTNNEEMQQHDVQELNRILFSAIEDSLVGTSGQNLIHKLYHGQVVNKIICSECGNISERQEDFVDIPLSVSKDSSSLEQALSTLYCELETMDGNNKYYCNPCQKLVIAKKGAKLRSLPPIMSFSLLRFSYDFVKMQRFKETGKFTFPKFIDMSAFVDSPSSDDSSEYELFSLVIHRGSTHGGHYHAYIKDIDGLGTWTETCKEVVVHQSSSSPALVSTKQKDVNYQGLFNSHKAEGPALMLMNILLKADNHTLPVDKLCMEFVKYSGVSWNKHFKKQHGPITQFLHSHSDKFDFNADNTSVSLVSSPLSSNDSQSEFLQTNGYTTSSSDFSASLPKKSQSAEGTQTTLNTGLSSNSDVSPPQGPEAAVPDTPAVPTRKPCSGWFDFDDSDVSPINEADIEKQFMGRESAYMLFYRKTSHRPPSAWSNPAYKVPGYLLQKALLDNKNIEKERLTYDSSIHQIALQIHYSCYYEYRDGALHPCENHQPFQSLVMDKRKTVAELKAAVTDLDQKAVQGPDIHIHRLKKLVAGCHLYEHLSADDSKVIESLPIKYGTKLFVWDGKQVQKQEIPVGIESEPILLTVIYGNPLQFSHAYSKSLSMADFKVLVSQRTGVSVKKISIKKLQQTGSQVSAIEICYSNNNSNEDQTLSALGLTDGDELVVEDKFCSGPSLTDWTITKRSKLLVSVENCCQQSTSSTVMVETDKDMLVSEVKDIALIKLGINKPLDETCLSIEKDLSSRKLPLWGEDMIQNVLAGTDHQLFLEDKPQLRRDEITVFVGFGASLTTTQADLELTLAKDETVEGCIGYIASKWDALLPVEGWHLRKVSWCGEPSTILNQLWATLESCQVNHGDRLLCERGKLPQKGNILISAWLFRTIDDEQAGVLSWLTITFQSLWNGSDNKAEKDSPIFLDNLEVSKMSTLEELKVRLMELPQLANVNNYYYLRLKVMEDNEMKTILKGHNNTIQNLKLPDTCQIGVQVLAKSENLRPEEILLTIKQRLCDSREYKDPVEMVWDTGQGNSVDHLKRTIANFLLIPEKDVLLAKYFPSKCEWTVLKDSNTQHNNKKGTSRSRRKNQHRTTRTQCNPYCIKDGDLIAVKNISEETGELMDFSTAKDDENKAEMKLQNGHSKDESSNKKNCGVASASNQDNKSAVTKSRKACPEVGLTIKVDKFT
ncbi:ubiquitin carboxyl-terminal hydrolase 40-like [Octopus vulgaris]|uniref:Ubiquitin carboxyl-terminal hydrolase 40-like n=1 Tax=Octopus vulgaris TaxID=6645 RepID=A0AA36B4B7_OCTVU|nr:ubiquitin carboxyl-terminal hydrolase 40-like [Octopus vulgaris]